MTGAISLPRKSVEIATKLILESGEPTADSRYSTTVLEQRIAGREGLKRLLAGEELSALVWAWGFGCGLARFGQPMFYFMSAWPEPVPAGTWKGWPEEHWRISNSEWEQLPLAKKAKLEAREQVSKHVALEYYGEWLDSYAPAEADKIWWDEKGHELSRKGKRVQLGYLYRQRAVLMRKKYLGNPQR